MSPALKGPKSQIAIVITPFKPTDGALQRHSRKGKVSYCSSILGTLSLKFRCWGLLITTFYSLT